MVLLKRMLLLVGLAALSGCTHLLFHPMAEHVNDPNALGIKARDVYFPSDGLRLHGWLLPARQMPAKGGVLFLHGNAENISTHLASVWWLPTHGYHVFLFDYRGYGWSEGRPTLDRVQRDAEAALATLRVQPEVQGLPLAVFGQSLGGALAIRLLADPQRQDGVAALIVEGVPTSFRARAREVLGDWWLTWALQWPLSLTISDAYAPLAAIGEVAPVPLLIVHGEEDTIIPISHGEALFAAAQEPKTFWRIAGARHINAFTRPAWRERLVNYLDERVTNAGRAGEPPSLAAEPMQ